MLREPAVWATLPGNLKGMAYALLSGMTFAAISGMVRHVSAEVHPFEIAFFRFINKIFASGGRETKHVRFSDPPDLISQRFETRGGSNAKGGVKCFYMT